MGRTNFNPKNFELDVDHPWTMAIHTNDMVVLNPQLDLDHPDDLAAQTTVSIGHIRKLLADIGCRVSDITNLRVSYVNKGDVDEDAYRQSIIDQLSDATGATIEMVPFDRLVLPELLVEICTYAMARPGRTALSKQVATSAAGITPSSPMSSGVRVGNMIFVGELTPRAPDGAIVATELKAQAKHVLDQLDQVLSDLGGNPSDTVRLNIFYDVSVSTVELENLARMLWARFDASSPPALTAIPLPRLFPIGTKIALSAWAMVGEDGTPLARKIIGPETTEETSWPRLWRHAVACQDMIVVGGQSTLRADGSVGYADDHVAQTHATMKTIDSLMHELGTSIQNVHKTNSYYVLSTVDEFNSNLEVRSGYFRKPGPGSVGLPLDTLAVDGQRIEVEAILVRE